MPTPLRLHQVCETPSYLRQAALEGMTAEERERVVAAVSSDPTAGDMIVGSNGCRKLRVAGRGKGKSGGYRIVTFYAAPEYPVFLLAVLSKGSRANFSKGEINAMAKATALLIASLGERATS